MRNRLVIDHSWQASCLVPNLGAIQYTHPTKSTKVCFKVADAAGNITTTVNRRRRVRPMSSLLLLDVHEKNSGRDSNSHRQRTCRTSPTSVRCQSTSARTSSHPPRPRFRPRNVRQTFLHWPHCIMKVEHRLWLNMWWWVKHAKSLLLYWHCKQPCILESFGK